jgi:predicted CoA-binding protein
MNWKQNILERQEEIYELLRQTRRIAVLGIKTDEQQSQPAFYVPAYLAKVGFEIIPVPVYYPEVTQILSRQVYRKLIEIPGEIDLINVFRRAQDLHGHVADILAKQPKAVWLQSGIRNNEIAKTLAKANIKVVQDRCLMVEHRYLPGGSGGA